MIQASCRTGLCRSAIHLLALLAALLAMGRAAPARAATPEQVDKAIEKAKQFIYSRINGEGNWDKTQRPPGNFGDNNDVNNGQFTGLTAIATYALLAGDEDPKDPRLAKAIDFLVNNESKGVYALGLRCQVWHMVGAERQDIKPAMEKDAKLLLKGAHDNGMYGYIVMDNDADAEKQKWDFSVSQYGVLGAWACEQEGYEIPSAYWKKVDAGWRSQQQGEGSWNYGERDEGHRPSMPMTAAGVASLFITQMELGKLKMQGGCLPMAPDPNIDKGLKWMSDHFREAFDGGFHAPYYGLYGIERVGVASGRKYFGTTDWYKIGAQWLVDKQEGDGHWGNAEEIDGTCYALLFLVRGRAPVIYEKLQYDGPWNQRPSDLSNLTGWIAREAEINRSYLNWQIVSLAAPVDELHDAPIMLICGDKGLDFTLDDERKLKQFVVDGGMLVFNADCGAPEEGNAFTISAEKLCMRLFPDAGEFEKLPSDHPINKGFTFHEKPRVLGLSNGIRELAILVPQDDPDRYWQADAVKTKHDSFELGKSLLFYCIDPDNLSEKGKTYIVRPDSGITATHTLKVARIQYNNGGWDPEPGGWERMKGVMHNRYRMDLDVQPVRLGLGLLDGYKVAVLTGVSKYTINDSQWAEIKKFVDGGGTLLMDAAGGSQDFDLQAQVDLNKNFLGSATALSLPLPPEHLLFTQIAGQLVVHYRPFSRRRHPALKDGIPMLCGIPAVPGHDRLGVFYSNVDLSAGLVGEDRSGVDGYTPACATDIVAHILLYVDSGGKPVADVAPPTPTDTPVPVPGQGQGRPNRRGRGN